MRGKRWGYLRVFGLGGLICSSREPWKSGRVGSCRGGLEGPRKATWNVPSFDSFSPLTLPTSLTHFVAFCFSPVLPWGEEEWPGLRQECPKMSPSWTFHFEGHGLETLVMEGYRTWGWQLAESNLGHRAEKCKGKGICEEIGKRRRGKKQAN